MDYERTLMMEKCVSHKYWKEAVSTSIYILNRVHVKKGIDDKPFQLWYGYAPNVKYFKIFGIRCYILKDHMNGQLDAKSDEVIFLGCSTKRKAYKSLKSNTNKVLESVNMKVDEYVENNEVECKKEPKDYIIFIYIDEGEPKTFPKPEMKDVKKMQQLVNVKLQHHGEHQKNCVKC